MLFRNLLILLLCNLLLYNYSCVKHFCVVLGRHRSYIVQFLEVTYHLNMTFLLELNILCNEKDVGRHKDRETQREGQKEEVRH